MKKIYVDCLSHYYRAALMEDGVLTELIYQDKSDDVALGDIYVGRIEKVLPSGISFVNVGKDKPVFLQRNDIKCGKEVIVQIEKEAVNEKCAVATDKLNINGKYAVVMYNDRYIGVSKKITDNEKRAELKAIGEKYSDEDYGIIMRTNCENADISEIEEEIRAIKSELAGLISRGCFIKPPYLLRRETDVISSTVRDLITNDCDSVIMNRDADVNYQYELYTGSSPLFNYFGIESQIEKLFHQKIWLRSGGYIVIDETEAMTVIDVNSGKAIGEKNYIKVNEEAAKECARQIRLRNLSGMIIIDFINVKGGNEKIYKTLGKYLSYDRVKTHIVGMTELGLMQITRQKKRKPLSQYISHKCPYCNGTGFVKSINYVCEKICGEIKDIFSATIYDTVEVSSSQFIVDNLKEYTCDIEKRYGKKIMFNVIQTARQDYYELKRFKLNTTNG